MLRRSVGRQTKARDHFPHVATIPCAREGGASRARSKGAVCPSCWLLVGCSPLLPCLLIGLLAGWLGPSSGFERGEWLALPYLSLTWCWLDVRGGEYVGGFLIVRLQVSFWSIGVPKGKAEATCRTQMLCSREVVHEVNVGVISCERCEDAQLDYALAQSSCCRSCPSCARGRPSHRSSTRPWW